MSLYVLYCTVVVRDRADYVLVDILVLSMQQICLIRNTGLLRSCECAPSDYYILYHALTIAMFVLLYLLLLLCSVGSEARSYPPGGECDKSANQENMLRLE